MTTATTPDAPHARPPAEPLTAGPRTRALPEVDVHLTADEVRARLLEASRRGRLPGFEPGEPGAGVLFRVAAFGNPIDSRLEAVADPAEPGRVRLRFRRRLEPRTPVILAVVLAATVWPGVYFMDQLIPGEWGWIPTWWWYLPLTVIPIPFAWRAVMRRAHDTGHESACRAVAQIAAELGGKVIPTATGS